MLGSGTQGDPYIIQNVTDLQAIEDNLSSYYELEGNIDASATSGWNSGAGFVPISLFAGQLDGKGFTISDLFINRASTSYIGLFGTLDNGAVLKNISMTGVDITGSSWVGALFGYAVTDDVVDIDNCNSAGAVKSTESSVSYIGGLIGQIADGTVDDCWSSCTLTVAATNAGTIVGGLIGYNLRGVITNCYATGDVTSAGGDVGGFIGRAYRGSCSKCYATGNAVAGHNRVGGFIGYISNTATLSNCYARGNAAANADYYAGGLIGYNSDGTIDDCYSTGAATDSGDNGNAGGLIGANYATVTNCFWDTETSGNATSDGGTGKTTTQMKTKSTFTDAGWDFTTIWYISGVINNGYPAFTGVTPGLPYSQAHFIG